MRRLLLIAAPILGSALMTATGTSAAPTVATAQPTAHEASLLNRVGYDDWYDDDDDDVGDYVVARPYPPPPAYAPPPVVVGAPPYVYGWPPLPPPRPASCGQYHYWNGAFCADARFRPPYVGPRW